MILRGGSFKYSYTTVATLVFYITQNILPEGLILMFREILKDIDENVLVGALKI